MTTDLGCIFMIEPKGLTDGLEGGEKKDQV
jgi:hypothetical protein